MRKAPLILFYSTLAFLVFANLWIIKSSGDSIVTDIERVDKADIGLVFGTSMYLIGGGRNPFFEHRINAAYDLIQSGKVNRLLLSGSKDSIYYNEPLAMQKVLLEMGVNGERIVLDDQGDRTLHSLTRIKETYDVDKCVLVTQRYHAYRAVFIAKSLGIEAQCFIADSPDFVEHFPALLREVFARPKAILDLYL